MSTPVANLSIELSAGVAGLKTDLGKAQREAERAAKAMEDRFNKAGAIIGGALLAGLAGVSAAVIKTVNEFDRIGDVAARLNTTSSALTALGFAAQQSGSSAETLEKGLGRLAKTIGDAIGGNTQAIDVFKRLGVSFVDASGQARSADSVFLEVAERFKGMKNGAEEASIAAALFGRGIGQELIPLLNEGRQGIGALTEEARAFGAVIGEDAVANAQEFKDNLDKLAVAGQSFFNGLANQILPALVEFSGASADAAREAGGLAQAGETVGRVLTAAAGSIKGIFDAGDVYAQRAGGVFKLLAGDVEGAAASLKNADKAAADARASLDRLVLGVETAEENAKRLGQQYAKVGASIKGTREFTISFGGVVQKLVPDVVRAAKAAEEAAKKQAALSKAQAESEQTAKALSKAQDDLAFSLDKAFRAGLNPATEKMQEFDAVTGKVTRTLVEDVPQAITRASDEFEGFGGILTVEAQAFQDNWLGATEAVQDAFADFIAGNIRSFEDFGDALESIARQFLSNLVRQFLSTNLSLPFPSFGGGGGAAGAGGFGGINFGGPGAGLGTRVGLGAVGAGVAYEGYQQGNPLQGAAGGALLGFQVAGPVGAIVGAILGGVAAALNDTTRRINVIGDDIVGTPGFRNFAPGSTFESRLGGFTFASIDNVSAQERQQLGQNIVNFDNTIADLLNDEQLVKVTDALSNFNLRLEEGAISAENILGQRFDAILATFDQDVQDFVNGAATLEERTARLAEILSRPQRLNALIESLEEVDRLSGLTPFERELDAINRQFDAAAEEARKLGADQAQLARIEELRGNAIERLNDLQRQNLDALLDDLRFDDLTDGLTPADRAIADINRRFDKLREQAIALGASQEDLELIERRRTAALREQADATRDSTDAIQEFTDAAQQSFQLYLDYQADWLEGLGNALQPVRDWLNRGASVSSENPLQQLTRSQQQFEDLARRASLGDFDAIRNIAGAGDALLQQAARFYGVGSADFQRYEALVRGTLTPLASVDGSQSMAVALGQLREIYQALLRFLQGGNGANNSGVMSGAQAQQLLNSLDRLSRRTDRVT